MFHRNPNTRTLIELLEASAQEYATVTYETMKEAIGMSVQEAPGHGYLATAIKHLLNEKNWVFEVIRKVGVRRAKPEEVVDNSGAAIRRQKRLANRAIRKMTALSPTEYESLPSAKQVLHNTRLSILGVVAEFSSGKAERKIQEKALGASLPPAKMLELMFAGKKEQSA